MDSAPSFGHPVPRQRRNQVIRRSSPFASWMRPLIVTRIMLFSCAYFAWAPAPVGASVELASFKMAAAISVWLFVVELPVTKGSIHLAGLKAPVQVERDEMGVPHLSAQSLEDLYLAQGYVTAQDRLWQMDLLRRVARGEIAEIAGPRGLPLDVDSRTLGMRVAADAAVAQLPEEQHRWITA